MSSVRLILTAIALLGFSGIPACLMPARSRAGQYLTVALMLIGGILGMAGVATALTQHTTPAMTLPWRIPWGGFAVAVDPISVIFLIPAFIVPTLGAIYGLGYWNQSDHPDNGRWLGAFYGLLAGAIPLVFIARDGVLFLIAWEIMALAAYFALVTEQDKPEVRQSGWVYFIATHCGTLCLFALFALWRYATGSFALDAVHPVMHDLAGPIFVLALIGFSFKAGLFPLHFWLPGAHANAPSHVSAIMSGILLKAGVYGIVRMACLLPLDSLWWGRSLLIVGSVTGLFGIIFALTQSDFKRLLAYSSIENVGIIIMGLGLAVLGRSAHRPDWVLLGIAGSLLHVWNHSLFKPLLFFNAGALLHATGTRQMDQLGGLAKRMPLTASLFALGAVAICGLPPLNGFVSEWLLYIGLFQTLGLGADTGGPLLPGAGVGIAAVVLAMIGALAVACFVKFFGAVYLGSPRGPAADHAHDPPRSMSFAMIVLASLCLCVGLLPLPLTPLLQNAARTWAGAPDADLTLAAAAPLRWITVMGVLLIAFFAVITFLLKTVLTSKNQNKAGTWDCGYARPTPRIQYTGSSFTQMLADLARWLVWPRLLRPVIAGLFPLSSRFSSDTPDLVLDRGLSPAAALIVRFLPWTRRFHQGSVHTYLLYLLLMVVLLFLLSS
ncbi:MAG: proton-conducting transporter transmembrane domain-containing protein [Phycisphaerales bacterium]